MSEVSCGLLAADPLDFVVYGVGLSDCVVWCGELHYSSGGGCRDHKVVMKGVGLGGTSSPQR